MEFLLTHQICIKSVCTAQLWKCFSQLLIKSQDFTQLCCFATTPLSAVFSRSSVQLHYLQNTNSRQTKLQLGNIQGRVYSERFPSGVSRDTH